VTVEKLIARVGADITGFEAGMGKVVSAAKKTALAVMGIATAAAVVGSKFEFELTKTATVAAAFGKDLEALEKKARKLGATTAFTATQAATGMYDLASAGMNTNQILAATEHAMKLAGATGTEMSQATTLLAASIKQFGLEAEDSKRIVDTFAQAITSSQLTMERLSQAMKYAGTTGAALGWDIEETTAAVAQFANLGLEGSMAGTNLRMSMISLSRQTSKVVSVLAELGLTYEDVNPETHTFGELMETVGKRAITGKQAVELFGSRAGLNMKRLAESAAAGTLQFDQFVQKLRDAQEGAGRADEMYKRLMETFRGQWKIVLSAAQDLLIEVFDTMKEEGVDLFKSLAKGFNAISGWVKENSDDIKRFWFNLRNWIEVVVNMTGALLGVMGKLLNVVISANREVISGLNEMHGTFTRAEAGVQEAIDKRMTWTKEQAIYWKAYREEVEKITGKEYKDIGLMDLIINRAAAAEAGTLAVIKALKEVDALSMKGALTQHEARMTEPSAKAPSFLPGAASPSEIDFAFAMKAFREALEARKEHASDIKEVVKSQLSDLEKLNAKYLGTAHDQLISSNKKEIEEITQKYDKVIGVMKAAAVQQAEASGVLSSYDVGTIKEKYDKLISITKGAGKLELQIAQIVADKSNAIIRKRAEVEDEYRKKMIDGASSAWEIAHQKAIAATDANNKAIQAEKDGIRLIENLNIQFAETSIDRIRLTGEREVDQIEENFSKVINLYTGQVAEIESLLAKPSLAMTGTSGQIDSLKAELALRKELLAVTKAQMEAATGKVRTSTDEAIEDEKVNAERMAINAILEANKQAAGSKFEMLRASHEMEMELDRQKNEDILKQLAETEEGKKQLVAVAAAQNMATVEKEAAHNRQIQEAKLDIANRMASQASATADALYQSGIIKGKKAFAALKAIKIVEAVIHTATAIIKTLGEPALPFPSNVIMAAMIGAMGAAQVYAISQQQPPAYASGGIVRGRQDGRGQMIRAGEYGDELVVPLRGGKVPVAVMGGGGGGGSQVVEQHEHYHFDNATFMDQNTLAASMETIAVAGVRRDYYNDGPTRSMIRGRR
jgi:TP901 family phage tail tape measure protein